MAVKAPEIIKPAIVEVAPEPEAQQSSKPEPQLAAQPLNSEDTDQPPTPVAIPEIKVSAFSLASVKAKREMEQASRPKPGEIVHLPTEPFTETDMLLQWTKYAQRLGDKGQKIMESYMLINDPKLRGTTIVHELPNEGSRVDFESERVNVQGYLRGKLQNHDLLIELVVNESIENKKAFTSQDRYNRLNQINPSLDLLRKTFDLDL
jgi:hypothetical protein